MLKKRVASLLGIGLLVPIAARADFTPQLTLGASLNRSSWNGEAGSNTFPASSNITVGGRLGYDISIIPLLSIDAGLTFEYHSIKVADSVKISTPPPNGSTVNLSGATSSLFWLGAGPSFRVKLGIVEPFAGIDFGYALFLTYNVPTSLSLVIGSSYGFAISPYGGVYVRALKWLAAGPIVRFTRFKMTNSFGDDLGTGAFYSVALSVKFNLP